MEASIVYTARGKPPAPASSSHPHSRQAGTLAVTAAGRRVLGGVARPRGTEDGGLARVCDREPERRGPPPAGHATTAFQFEHVQNRGLACSQ